MLKRFVDVEKIGSRAGEGHSMYLRPTCVATDPFLGVGVPQEATLYVIASPVGPYFPDGVRQAHHGRRRYGECRREERGPAAPAIRK